MFISPERGYIAFTFQRIQKPFQGFMNQWLGLNKSKSRSPRTSAPEWEEGAQQVPQIAFGRWMYGQAVMVNIY